MLQENVGGMNVMSVTLRRLGPPNRWDTPIGMFYLVKNGKDSLDVFLRISEDEAKSFGEPIKVNQERGYHVMNNDRVKRLSSRRLLAPVAYTDDVERSNHFVSFCFLSDDDGKTWSHVRDLETQNDRGYAYTRLGFVGSRAVLSYWDHESSLGRYSARFRSVPTAWFYGDAR